MTLTVPVGVRSEDGYELSVEFGASQVTSVLYILVHKARKHKCYPCTMRSMLCTQKERKPRAAHILGFWFLQRVCLSPQFAQSENGFLTCARSFKIYCPVWTVSPLGPLLPHKSRQGRLYLGRFLARFSALFFVPLYFHTYLFVQKMSLLFRIKQVLYNLLRVP
jgi:hypothetical protein